MLNFSIPEYSPVLTTNFVGNYLAFQENLALREITDPVLRTLGAFAIAAQTTFNKEANRPHEFDRFWELASHLSATTDINAVVRTLESYLLENGAKINEPLI